MLIAALRLPFRVRVSQLRQLRTVVCNRDPAPRPGSLRSAAARIGGDGMLSFTRPLSKNVHRNAPRVRSTGGYT